MATVLICIALALCVFFALRHILHHGSCSGCEGGCAGCSGHCAGCTSCGTAGPSQKGQAPARDTARK